jgi:hypothetical protein
MATAEKIPWTRIAAEAIAIVASILLAFWIDAWWETRAERALEREYLSALSVEFEATREEVTDQIEFSSRVIQLVDEVLYIAAQPDDEAIPGTFSQTLGDVYGIRRPNPVTSIYQDMVSSGNILLVDDQELRTLMASLMSTLDEIAFHSNAIVEIYWMNHAPFVDRHLVVSDFGWFTGPAGRVGQERNEIFSGTPESPFEIDTAAIRTREFWNLMFDWKTVYADQLGPLIRARNVCDRIVEMLSSRLEGIDA